MARAPNQRMPRAQIGLGVVGGGKGLADCSCIIVAREPNHAARPAAMQAVTHLARGTPWAAAAGRPLGNRVQWPRYPTARVTGRIGSLRDWLIAEEEKLASGGDRRQGIHRGGKG